MEKAAVERALAKNEILDAGEDFEVTLRRAAQPTQPVEVLS